MYLSNRPVVHLPPRAIVVRGPNGVLHRLGFGDAPINGPLDKAKQALLNAGYAGAECRTETVYYPNGSGGSYTQNVCSAPGYDGSFDADLASKMTPAQLAAQRQYELNSGTGEGQLQSYFQATAGAPNIAVGATTGAAAVGNKTVAANWDSSLNPVKAPPPAAPTPPPAAAPTPPAAPPAAPPPASSSLPAGLNLSSSVAGFPLWAVGLAGLAFLPMLFSGGRR